MSRPIKHCPFCGGQSKVITAAINSTWTSYYVECCQCSALGPEYYEKEEAINKWNLRYSPKKK